MKAKVAETTEEPNDAQAAEIEKLNEELEELEGFKSDFVDNKDYDALISFRIGACLFSLRRPWEAYVAFGDVVDNHKEFAQITLSTYYYILCLRQLGRNEDAQKPVRRLSKSIRKRKKSVKSRSCSVRFLLSRAITSVRLKTSIGQRKRAES